MYLPNWLMSIMLTISREVLMPSVSLHLRGSFCIEKLWCSVGGCALIPDRSLIFCLGLAHLMTSMKYVSFNGHVTNRAGGRPCRERHLRPPDFFFLGE